MLTLFKKRWAASEAKTRERQRELKAEASVLEKKIRATLDLMLASESPTVVGAFERKVEELERKRLLLEERTARCGTQARGFDETFRTAFEFISNPWNLWENGSLEDKRIVLKLTLTDHLEYDWNGSVRTAEISMPFKVLLGKCDCENDLAERVGFEPTVSLHPRRISSAVHSTTLPPLRGAKPRGASRRRGYSEGDGRCQAR